MYRFYKKVNVVYCKNMNWDKWVTGENEVKKTIVPLYLKRLSSMQTYMTY